MLSIDLLRVFAYNVHFLKGHYAETNANAYTSLLEGSYFAQLWLKAMLIYLI